MSTSAAANAGAGGMGEDAPLPSSVISDPVDIRSEFLDAIDAVLDFIYNKDTDFEAANVTASLAAAQPAANAPAAAAAAQPAADAIEESRASRSSRRIAANDSVKAVKAAEAKAAADALAAAAEEAAARRKAAKEAAKEGTQGASRAKLATIPNAIYESACQNLLPIFMVPARALDAEYKNGKLGLGTILEKGLTAVCELVYGPGLARDLAYDFTRDGSSPYIRHFFEITEANDQCRAIIDNWERATPPVPCWLCGVGVNACPAAKDAKKGSVDCEHKLSVLPALLLTGLFDRRFARILREKGLVDQYKGLLKLEYAWSHGRCNQIKTDDVFITCNVDRAKIVTFGPNHSAITKTLKVILTHASYQPTKDQLWECIQAQAPPSPATKEAWPAWRTGGVEAQLADLCAKLNARGYTAKQLVAHFVNGLLDRAIYFAPTLVNKYLNTPNGPNLTEAQVATLEALLASPPSGGRRRTRHRRSNRKRTWRKTYRGGADEGYDVMAAIALSLTKAACIDVLSDRIDTAAATISPDSLGAIAPAIEDALDKHQLWTDGSAMDVLAKARASGPKTVQQLCVAIARELFRMGLVGDKIKPVIEPLVRAEKREREVEGKDESSSSKRTASEAAAPAAAAKPQGAANAAAAAAAASSGDGDDGEEDDEEGDAGMGAPAAGPLGVEIPEADVLKLFDKLKDESPVRNQRVADAISTLDRPSGRMADDSEPSSRSEVSVGEVKANWSALPPEVKRLVFDGLSQQAQEDAEEGYASLGGAFGPKPNWL